MKHWFKLYVCTLRKDLSIILAIAILFIFVMDMWLKNIPAPNSFFVAIGNFWYALSIAYVSSFVFYFFVVHYNRQKEKSLLYGYIGGLFNMIINDGKSIFADMVKKAGLNIDPKKMTHLLHLPLWILMALIILIGSNIWTITEIEKRNI